MRNFLKLRVLVVLGFIFCNIFLANPVRAEVWIPDVIAATRSTNVDCVTNPSCYIIADSVTLDLVESKIVTKSGSLILFDSVGQKLWEVQMRQSTIFLDSTWHTVYLVRNFNDVEIFTANNGKYNKIREDKIEEY